MDAGRQRDGSAASLLSPAGLVNRPFLWNDFKPQRRDPHIRERQGKLQVFFRLIAKHNSGVGLKGEICLRYVVRVLHSQCHFGSWGRPTVWRLLEKSKARFAPLLEGGLLLTVGLQL